MIPFRLGLVNVIPWASVGINQGSQKTPRPTDPIRLTVNLIQFVNDPSNGGGGDGRGPRLSQGKDVEPRPDGDLRGLVAKPGSC